MLKTLSLLWRSTPSGHNKTMGPDFCESLTRLFSIVPHAYSTRLSLLFENEARIEQILNQESVFDNECRLKEHTISVILILEYL